MEYKASTTANNTLSNIVNEEKFTCLLLHGMAQSSGALLSLQKIFENKHYPCFAPQLTGHRHTLPKDFEVSFHNLTLELETLMRYITHDFSKKIIISGHSFGAMLALYLSQIYPQSIKGLILLSPSFVLKSESFNNLISLLKFIPDVLIRKIPNIKKGAVTDKHSGSKDYYSPVILKHLSILRSEINKNLNEIQSPIFIIQSTNDYHLNPISSIKIKEYAKKARVKIALRNLGEYHNLANIPEIENLIEEGLRFICQEK